MCIRHELPRAPAARGKGRVDRQADAVASETHASSRVGLGCAQSPLQLPAQRGEAGAGPDGDAEDGDGEVCEAGRELCQLALILCSMVRC